MEFFSKERIQEIETNVQETKQILDQLKSLYLENKNLSMEEVDTFLEDIDENEIVPMEDDEIESFLSDATEYLNPIFNEQQNEVIYDFGSDNEEVRMEAEPSVTSNTPRTSNLPRTTITSNTNPANSPFNYDWEDISNDRSRAITRASAGISNTIPIEFIPKRFNTNDSGILNLDCIRNKREAIDYWGRMMLLYITSDPNWTKQVISKEVFWNFILFKTIGSVYDYLVTHADKIAERIDLRNTDDQGILFKKIQQVIYEEFCGGNTLEQGNEYFRKIQQEARWHLNNVQICDMCYFEEYACNFRKYFYKLPKEEQPLYIQIFLQKLPWPIGMFAIEKFAKDQRELGIANTLGGAEETVKTIQAEMCMQKRLKHTMKHKNSLCCKDSDKIPGQYGCNRRYTDYKKKFKRYKFKKKPYKFYKKEFKKNPRGRFFKKSNKPFRRNKGAVELREDKEKYCPEKKKDCKCWLCHEIGHYANKCPNKDKVSKNKINLLFIARNQYDLEPIETELSSDEEYIYEAISDEESGGED